VLLKKLPALLLIAPEGIEIRISILSFDFSTALLIAPEGIEMNRKSQNDSPEETLNRTRRN